MFIYAGRPLSRENDSFATLARFTTPGRSTQLGRFTTPASYSPGTASTSSTSSTVTGGYAGIVGALGNLAVALRRNGGRAAGTAKR
jgi:hypothetical protein